MATKKNHYYVLVMTDNGPMFVTSIGEHHMCYWDEEKEPKEFSKAYAEDIAFGLRMNMFTAYLVVSPREEECQPYNYKAFNCTFTRKEREDEEE